MRSIGLPTLGMHCQPFRVSGLAVSFTVIFAKGCKGILLPILLTPIVMLGWSAFAKMNLKPQQPRVPGTVPSLKRPTPNPKQLTLSLGVTRWSQVRSPTPKSYLRVLIRVFVLSIVAINYYIRTTSIILFGLD